MPIDKNYNVSQTDNLWGSSVYNLHSKQIGATHSKNLLCHTSKNPKPDTHNH